MLWTAWKNESVHLDATTDSALRQGELKIRGRMPKNNKRNTRSVPKEVYLGLGIFARTFTNSPPGRPLMSLRVWKPSDEGGEIEVLLDKSAFRQLCKLEKRYKWKKK